MLSCKEVVRILGSSEALSLSQKVQLRMHLWICKYCSVYARQMKAMKEGYRKLFRERTAISRDVVDQVESTVINTIGRDANKS